MINRSDQIDLLASAMSAAQRVMEGAEKSASNPFFKSKYADLSSVWAAIREPLSANGIAVIQMPSAEGAKVTITTLLVHSSGQWISSGLTVTAKEDTPQAIGSAITYIRRYALQSFAGVAPEDDDGNAAQGRPQAVPPKQQATKTVPNNAATDEPDLRATINDAAARILGKYKEIDCEKDFTAYLGREGYSSIAEIPEDYRIAQKVIEGLKVNLAEIKKAIARR